MKNTRTVRKKVRLKSLLKQFNTRVRRELLDADYLKQLSPAELKWYAQFTDEYVGGAVAKTPEGDVKKGYLHNTPELAKRCYDDNNRRNSDLYSIGRANNLIHTIETTMTRSNKGNSPADAVNHTFEASYITNTELTEDALIADLDRDPNEYELSFKEYVMVRKNMLQEVRDVYDLKFLETYPNSYLYYTIYDSRKLTEKQIERLINKPELLEKLLKNAEFMKRKKNGAE